MPRRLRFALAPLVGLTIALAVGSASWADDDDPLLSWSRTAARGLFDLCRQDAPDAAVVADHGEIWGWPRFMGYLEHPEGYRREAGGSSRRTFSDGDKSTYVEATIQSGVVTSADPAEVHYFRCNAASDQPVGSDLEAYFTEKYGPPASKTAAATVWLAGAAKGAAADDDDAALKSVIAAGAGAQATRVELTRENGRDRAKLTLFQAAPAN